MDQNEIKLLHDQDIHVLVIFNHFTEPVGYDNGVAEAKEAIKYAKELNIPEGVAIFGDIEPDYPVDSAFIEGWFDELSSSEYEPALYGVFDKGSKLVEAFEATNDDAYENTIIWTAHPQVKITAKDKAPKYEPEGPKDTKILGWQYGIESEQCIIDTNLYKNELIDFLW